MTPSPEEVARWHRWFAVELNNHAWELLEQAERNAATDRELLAAAHGARFHWYQVGDAANLARADYLVSRAHAALAHATLALEYAERSLAIAEDHALGPWDRACGHEAVARAASLLGDGVRADRAAELARRAAADIVDEEDRRYFLETLLEGGR